MDRGEGAHIYMTQTEFHTHMSPCIFACCLLGGLLCVGVHGPCLLHGASHCALHEGRTQEDHPREVGLPLRALRHWDNHHAARAGPKLPAHLRRPADAHALQRRLLPKVRGHILLSVFLALVVMCTVYTGDDAGAGNQQRNYGYLVWLRAIVAYFEKAEKKKKQDLAGSPSFLSLFSPRRILTLLDETPRVCVCTSDAYGLSSATVLEDLLHVWRFHFYIFVLFQI